MRSFFSFLIVFDCMVYSDPKLQAYFLSFCFRLPMLLFLPLTRTYVWWKLHIILLFLNCMWQHAWYAMVVKKSGPLLLLNLVVSLPNLGTVHFLMFLICKTLHQKISPIFKLRIYDFFLWNWMLLMETGDRGT